LICLAIILPPKKDKDTLLLSAAYSCKKYFYWNNNSNDQLSLANRILKRHGDKSSPSNYNSFVKIPFISQA
jgi:hypothetical protein